MIAVLQLLGGLVLEVQTLIKDATDLVFPGLLVDLAKALVEPTIEASKDFTDLLCYVIEGDHISHHMVFVDVPMYEF